MSDKRERGAQALLQPTINADGKVAWSWVIPRCPYCHTIHRHKAGESLANNPFRYLGARNAHCRDGQRKYYLIYSGLLPVRRENEPLGKVKAVYKSNPDHWLADTRKMQP